MKVYLDNAATTKLDPKVIKAMNKAMRDYGNPSSMHSLGEQTRTLVEDARVIIAKSINATPDEIYFTSGGTESNNLVIRGIVKASKKKVIITSKIEHASVIETCKDLEKEGYKVHYISVNKEGVIDLEELKKKISNRVALVTIMHANNEIGTIQPIEKIARICSNIPFHTDAVQSYMKQNIDVKKTKVTALSISAHKIHGPKGIGALYLKKGTKIKPISTGGNQENNLRPGTENVVNIVGFAKAATLKQPVKQMQKLRDYMIKEIIRIPGAIVNGEQGLCNNIHTSFEGIDGETLLNHLNLKNIYVSTGSACDSKSQDPSHVLKAIGLTKIQAYGSIRFSLSKYTTSKEIDYTLKHLKSILTTLRAIN